MDRNIIDENISYQNISWKDVPGNPFGNAGAFNAIIFGDANNIVDTKGAMAIGGSFYSPRGLSLNFGENVDAPEYTPDNIAFLVGGNVAMNGSLVVVGHVVVNGGFRAARGSTFLIGKDGSSEQIEDLSYLYEANGQSQYWSPSDRGNHYIISSYDVPHYLPARKIDANVSKFFSDARESVDNYKDCPEPIQTEPIEPSQPTPEPIPMPMPPTPTPQRPMPEAPAPQIPARPEPTPSIPSPMPARPPREERPIPTPPIQPIRPAIPMERPCVEPITCPECLIEEGLISGCIWGCECCKSHMWKVKLYEICNNEKVLVACLEIDNYGCFEFCVPYEGCYTLCVSPVIYHKNQYCFNQNKYPCKAILSLNNIGVSNFYI